MANSTFDRMKHMSTSDSNLASLDKESPPPYITFRKRLTQEQDSGQASQASFQTTVLSILNDMKFQQQIQFEALTKDIEDIKIQNLEIKKTQKDLTKFTQYLSEEYEKLKMKTENLEQKINSHIKTQNENLNTITQLEENIEDLQRKLREKSIEIRNIPYEEGENILNTVEKLYKTINQEFYQSMITAAYRRPSKDTNKRSIILELSNLQQKVNLLNAVKNFNKQHTNKPIYINNLLTAHASKLFFLGRELKRNHNYKYCWTKSGKVYVKKEDGTTAILLKSEDQVEALKKM